MKCPNCRCVVPGNTDSCSYCGYEFSSGSAETLSIEEAYYDKFYEGDYRDFPFNSTNYYNNMPVSCYSQSFQVKKKKKGRKARKDRDSRGMSGDVFFITTMVGMSCLAIILSLLLLVI